LSGSKLLSCLRKRDLLNSDSVDTAEFINLGARYLEEERISDAVDYFEKAGYQEGLTQVLELCLTEGDYFLFTRLARILSLDPSPEQWTLLGDNALSQGKLLFARSAYQKADLPEKLVQVERLLNLPPQEQTHEKARLH